MSFKVSKADRFLKKLTKADVNDRHLNVKAIFIVCTSKKVKQLERIPSFFVRNCSVWEEPAVEVKS